MLDKGSPCPSGLGKSPENQPSVALMSAASQPDDFVCFFYHIPTQRLTFLLHYHIFKTIPDPL